MSGADDLLFDPSLIPASCSESLGSDLELRPLRASDGDRGHLELLTVLTVAPKLSSQSYADTFNHLRSCPNTYFTIVIIVSCGSIIIERKFVRSSGLVGHIEDIAVSKSMQGRKLGLKIINTLEEVGRGQGVYKIILDCSKENIPFYEKCGFKHKEYEMVRYIEAAPSGSSKPSSPAKL
ncbi:acyl-CoA N-acyltransferase [Dioszegia hungarica]|uniref:Glucosamine 6-phosphate N-acetyltransferase n=1 Tax=Dioszegia hungarica TaxID=4972 RepID=A0AA38H953_9TREE|nr:acyl-CoA N-acyltransferase [Dioszegia hungarica]KAI9636608.1 acyl-CoA N-acyltransferase [Dioszegia hungarica]